MVLLADPIVAADPVVEGQARDTLVILEDSLGSMESTHGAFLRLLRERAEGYGGRVTLKHHESIAAKGSGFALRRWGRWTHDSVVVLAPSLTSIGGEKASEVLGDFVESGRSAFLVGSPTMSGEVRDLAKRFGVAFHDGSAKALDLFENRGGDGEVIRATNYGGLGDTSSVLRAGTKSKPLLWSGVGAYLDPRNPLASQAVAGHSTTFCPTKKGFVSKKKGLRKFTGTDVSLVSVVQARNNARVVVTGSLSMLSDEFMADGETSNRELSVDVTDWVLGYKSVLRHGRIEHSLLEGMGERGETKDRYRIKDKLAVSMKVEEWSAAKQEWLPFEGEDLQLEFTMLDPHLRKTFSKDAEGTFVAEVVAPDVYGVFKFVVDYNSLGYSYIHVEEQVPIRPFRHDEYERFIAAAYPYYASIFSTMAAFFLFGFSVLYTK
ncbi:dolichyl-diphosphooligosaccharide-protein glycosyltransferase [Chloropicon primus]|uniref:Dolichyl-diphosphooligosaccharide--protein glycosyltransferase 48 kDa subunit n=1 Tax=Chloropicon primus TaxID=1764295 RepID=A0A5B8MVU7_9CHLO|nr:dolichyl-diphosphooligosaccharide-protein glycosyltransferase [Chloropicon primus]UPR04137.1 dolichyl-diphosphooligosaccharide-protein glycosyltransferase [Chloropicon primus]|eukprot:QDZ24928.1 dolichyl-diphosphooligosaccharide-protein glycosyltransferase [Chloropicon primus]